MKNLLVITITLFAISTGFAFGSMHYTKKETQSAQHYAESLLISAKCENKSLSSSSILINTAGKSDIKRSRAKPIAQYGISNCYYVFITTVGNKQICNYYSHGSKIVEYSSRYHCSLTSGASGRMLVIEKKP